jgi:hippurate hydrolase
VTAPAVAPLPVVNDPALISRLASALKGALGDQRVVEMPAKMTSEDFAYYGAAGVPSALLHIGAVSPARLEESRRTGIPVPAPHSPEWAPEYEPTLKGAIRAEVAALLELLR